MTRSILTIALLLACAVSATAQDGGAVRVSVGFAAQPSSDGFADVTAFPYFAETANVRTDYTPGVGTGLDIAGSGRVWRKLRAGVAVTRVALSTPSETTATLPHPFFFNQNRRVDLSTGLNRIELGVHLSAAMDLLSRPNLIVQVFGGPSVFNFRQRVVEELDLTETFPYDSIAADAETGRVTGSAVGFHAGADVAWFFHRRFGVGGLVRFTAASKELTIGEGEPFDLNFGGVQGGIGVRFRF